MLSLVVLLLRETDGATRVKMLKVNGDIHWICSTSFLYADGAMRHILAKGFRQLPKYTFEILFKHVVKEITGGKSKISHLVSSHQKWLK